MLQIILVIVVYFQSNRRPWRSELDSDGPSRFVHAGTFVASVGRWTFLFTECLVKHPTILCMCLEKEQEHFEYFLLFSNLFPENRVLTREN